MDIRTRWQQASRRQRIALVLVGAWLLYALLGYFLLSPWLRSTLQSTVSEVTGRQVVLEKVVFNPLALSLSVQGFALKDADNGTLFGFDEFYANFQLSSLFRWSWHFDQISLFAPTGRVVQTGEDSFNFDDIVARLAVADEADAAEAEAAPTLLPRFSFRELLLVQGDFRFRDEAREQPDELVLAPVSFQILDFSTRADGQGNNAFEFAVTGPAGGRLDWAGSVAFDPVIAAGRLSLSGVDLSPFAEFFQHQVAFRVPSATLDIASDYRFEADPDGRLRLSEGGITLTNLEIRDPQLEQAVLSLPLLELSGVEVDSIARQVGIERLLLRGLEVDVRLRNDGLHLQQLFAPVAAEQNEPLPVSAEQDGTPEQVVTGDSAAAEEAEEAEEAGKPWQVLLARLELADAGVTVIDETLAEPATLVLTPINLVLEQVAFNRDEVFSLTGDITVAETGRVQLSGEGSIEPLAVTLRSEVSTLPLAAMQGWIQDSAAVTLSTGELAANLTIEHGAVVRVDEATDDTRISGQLVVTGLNLQESNGSPLLAFSSLSLDGIALSLLESRLNIDAVTLADLRARSLIDDGGNDVSVRISVPASEQPGPSSKVETESQSWRLDIGSLRLRNGELVHIDRSLSPAFRVGLYRLDGEVRGLSSDPRRKADVNLSARLDQTSPFAVRGKIAPLAELPQMDLTIVMSGYDMTSVTPFTGQYLGYAVESGQLALDSRIAIDGSMLDSESRIRAANFFLGDSVPSDEALKAPIKLGLAVLRDRSGMIDLPVKATGDLNDPSVSVSGIILRAITNVMVKAATSPFSALASLAGGEELNHIDFVPGDNVPTEAGRTQIATLAQLLGERPSLLMNLSGSAQQADRLPLAALLLGRQLMPEQWNGLELALDDRDFRRAVQNRYRETTGERAELLLDDTVIDDREQRDRIVTERAFVALAQRDADALDSGRLNELAAARAQRSKTILVDEFGLDGERLFIVSATLDSEAALSGVVLSLGAR
jgi:hypothetical protein